MFGAKLRCEIERGDRVVASHAHVVFAAHLHRVLDVLDEVRRRRLATGSEERHRVNADDAALRRQQPQLLVGLVAGQVSERRASAMRHGDRFRRHRDRVGRGPASAVTEIHEHSQLVHATHHVTAEVAESRIAGLEAAVAKQIAHVVRELDDAHAEIVKDVDA